MRSKSFASDQVLKSTSNSNNQMVFSSVDNQPSYYLQPQLQSKPSIFKSIRPIDDTKKENYNSHVFISSSYTTSASKTSIQHSKNNNTPFIRGVISQTFNGKTQKLEQTHHRPTMGGKTVSSIQPPRPSNHNDRMSCQELKLLSRRINVSEPLSSPHASPKKPPLPKALLASTTNTHLRKRKRNNEAAINPTTTAVTLQQQQPPTKLIKTEENSSLSAMTAEYICDPCNKRYKTKNGYTYHAERCKYLLFEQASTKSIIKCICENQEQVMGTMIECVSCCTWLHMKCVVRPTSEDNYCCPRCIAAEQDDDTAQHDVYIEQKQDDNYYLQHSGKTIRLSSLQNKEEEQNDLLQSLRDIQQQEQQQEETHSNSFDFFSNQNTCNDGKEDGLFNHQSVINDSLLEQQQPLQEDGGLLLDFNTPDWCEDVPSLLYDVPTGSSSFLDDFSSSNDFHSANDFLLSPDPTAVNNSSSNIHQIQQDWLHFANFDVDFTGDGLDQDQ